MIRVLIAEDHGVVRDGLARLLSAVDDMTVVATASDGEEAVALAAEHKPDVVLMDLSMPRLDGTAATSQIMAADPGMQVVILTSFSDQRQILAALDAGATGYLLKDAGPDELVSGIRAAARRESPLAPKAASALLSARAEQRSGPSLSPRELEVLRLVAEGLPNKLIAQRLEISEKTVKAHLTSVFASIGVTDRTQAALWARDNGLV